MSANTSALAQDLAAIVGPRFVRSRPAELLTFAADGLPTHRAIPACVAFPGSTREVSALLRHLHAADVPFVARGAGTGLSGGALAEAPAVLIVLTRMARILAVDPANRRAVVEPGVVNASLARAAAPHSLHYAPDPSSQTACTIGGNVAENAGGPHCLKYGVTANHILALEVVLAGGEVVRLGSASGEPWGPDLAGLFVGSEGTFGIATEITVRLVPLPPTVRTILADFTTLRTAGEAVTRIIAAGIVPAALEMMDQSAIRIVEASIYAAGYPTDAAAVLLVECDGRAGGTAADIARAEAICREAGARGVRTASSAAERERLWQGRKKAFGAMGRISADLLVQDTTVPRTALPDVLERVAEIGARHHLRVTNVCHAGDGNLHPNLSFDASDPEQLEHVALASREIMEVCVAAGGTITGEHGVGVDKRKYLPLVFGPDDLGLMDAVRGAFDTSGRANPGKVIPAEDVRAWRAGAVVSGAIPTREAPPTPAPTATFPAPLPAAAAAVAENVRRASAEGARLQPRGAGTWWPDLAPGVRALDLAPLSDVARLDPANLVVTAGAGCRLDALDARLAAAGVWLALDPPGSAARTVGSVLATGGAGPLAARYGAPRDQLLGLTVVAGNGVPLRMGGRVVKNVAGFDVAKAVVGGHGAFGAIVEAHLRLHALPASDRGLAWAGSQRDVDDAAARILAAGAAPAALEVLDPPLAHAVLGSGGWALLVRDLGSTAAVDEELAVIACAVGRTLRLVDVAPEAPWLAWRTTVGAWPVLLRIGADPAAWSDAAALARQHLGEGLGASVTVPRGTVRVGCDSATPGAVRALRAAAALRGWPVVLERADALLRAAAGVWGELSTGAFRLTERLRREYDPHGVFAVPLLP